MISNYGTYPVMSLDVAMKRSLVSKSLKCFHFQVRVSEVVFIYLDGEAGHKGQVHVWDNIFENIFIFNVLHFEVVLWRKVAMFEMYMFCLF